MMAGVDSALTHLECSACGRRHDADRLQNLCPCGGPLLARYDLGSVRVTPADIAARRPGLWRWAELLPVRDPAQRVSLGEGDTPLLALPRFGTAAGLPRLMIKDEGMAPTGSFKARGAAVGVSRARELGARHVALPTNGNAGAAWSAYGARAGLQVTVAVPVGAPAVTRAEAVATGADVRVVDGLIGAAGRLVGDLAGRDGWFEAATLKEPYRVEGKKTMGLEIAERLGWRAPEVVVCPTGGGVGLIGIAKAFAELRELGLADRPADPVRRRAGGRLRSGGPGLRRRARHDRALAGPAHRRVRDHRCRSPGRPAAAADPARQRRDRRGGVR
jgi:threonine synthase